ncbi:MAG: sigma-54-dependent Fis family transcriptional regulator [Nitrospinae bacterium]|nr:sigma-54-dependent Fis family transcriptional regulator [Nitrospinota bacterium]MBL7021627.1 sigma-54-dependent Fis family transcriptional regulator [Nitrospinaceae bacterium]
MTQNKILIVDDEQNIIWVLKKGLEKKNYLVHTAASGEEALKKLAANQYLMMFSDIFMGETDGLQLLEQTRQLSPDLKVVMMTAQDTMNNTIEAMRLGAYDYITKPFDFDEVFRLIDKVEIAQSVSAPASDLPDPNQEAGTQDTSITSAIIGKSKRMQEIFKTIGKSAGSDLPVLITGESGTGKEMVASTLHQYSHRKDQPFICINCAAISRELLESELFGHERGAFTGAIETKTGKFQQADGGTLFLDEIGDMELALQAKILRVLQNNEFYRVGGKNPITVNVRIIAATNQNLGDMMNLKRFREDLYHRLNVIHIDMPPLRERLEDVPLLANHFIHRYANTLARGKVYLSPDVERILSGYHWSGNIRELENVIKRALMLALSGPILPEHLPPHLQEDVNADDEGQWDDRLNQLLQDFLLNNHEDGTVYETLIQKVEKHLFEILLSKHSGKQVATAKVLGINRNTLKRKIDSMKISPKNHKSNGS